MRAPVARQRPGAADRAASKTPFSPCCARWADPVTDSLGFGFTFHDLAGRDGLVRLDRAFLAHLADRDADAACVPAGRARDARYIGAARRERPDHRPRPASGCVPADLFGIEVETDAVLRGDAGAGPDPRLQAPVRAAPGGEEIPRSVRLRRRRAARGAGGALRRAADRTRLRRRRHRLGKAGDTKRWTRRCATPPGPR